MSSINKYGLSRTIPPDVKEIVRQHCGFGCVICGAAIIEYDHVKPEFADARKHDPKGITLLCPNCHAKKSRNFLSRSRVLEAMKQPAARKAGFAFSELETSQQFPYIVFSGTTIVNCPTPIQVRGYPVLKVEPAENLGGPYRLSASFFDNRGKPSLFIRQNEWQVFADSWDVEAKAGQVIVKSAREHTALHLRFDPGAGVVVERLDMYCGGYRFEGNADTLFITHPSGGRGEVRQCFVSGARVGMSFD